MKEGHEVRKYQWELARPGINGENYIIIAPTGSGKTLVAALVISSQLQRNQSRACCHVVFVVPTKPLAEQQKEEFARFIPGAKVGVYTGDTLDTVADSIRQRNDITVCTAGKLHEEMQNGKVTFDQISLVVFDECHHTKKRHPYALLMLSYLECHGDLTLPQIIGMTASPGAGENPDLDKVKTIQHLLSLAAHLDATSGFCYVKENREELQQCTKNTSISLNILKPRDASNDPFIGQITVEMTELEDFVPDVKNLFEKWSQKYETKIQQVKSQLELASSDKRDQISTLELLRCYSNALSMYMDLQKKDAVKVMLEFTGLPQDDAIATPHERSIKSRMNMLIEGISKLPLRENPLLEGVRRKLHQIYHDKPTSRAILFIRTKNHAFALKEWVLENSELSCLIPDVITGHTRDTGTGMTQTEQQEVMDKFRTGKTNLLIATSVAEEGLDVPECNLMIRYLHVSDEIAHVQTEGRARAEDSEGIVIISSRSKMQFQELKNKALNKLVDEVLEKEQFPSGDYLRWELGQIQQQVVEIKKMKAAMKVKKRRTHTGSNVKLLCKKCKKFACNGSDVYKLSDSLPTEACAEDKTSYHYVVPDPEFKKKLITKEHHRPGYLIKNQVKKTHKIHCSDCDKDWGVLCIWPAEGHQFPVLKCISFLFQINGNCPQSLKKWTAAPFEIEHFSTWHTMNSSSELEGSLSDSDQEYD